MRVFVQSSLVQVQEVVNVFCADCISYCSWSPSTDGTQLCTCGGDGIVRILDPSSRLEVISKQAPEVFQ